MTSVPLPQRPPQVRAAAEAPRRRMALEHAEREVLARALASAVEGEVRFDAHNRMLYATDASLYQVEPLGVVIPASIDDAVRAVGFCAANDLPILPRGGGTSLAGQCTNRAVVLDFTGRCRRVLGVDEANRTVRVEPGVSLDDLNDAIAGTGLFFAPDPATSKHASVGGCIGNNAAGARSIKYGRTSESVVSVEGLLSDGTRLTFGAGGWSQGPRARALHEGVVDVVRRYEALIRERFPKTVRRNAGYGLDMILKQLDGGATAESVNLAPLLCGSEGTLAVTLGATLKLHPRPACKALAVLSFASVDDAIAAVPAILSTGPSAVELLDDLVISLARANAEYRAYVELLPPAPGGEELAAVLYVEYFAAAKDELDGRLEALRGACPKSPVQVHTQAQAMLSAWKLRKAGEPLLHGIPGARKPITFVEDNAIPVENLARFVKELRGIVAAQGTRAAFYAHASVGVLHVRPLLDVHDPQDRERMQTIAVQTADLARSLGGVMSGEHGDGRIRGPLLERFYGPELMGAFREIKRLFDPADLLNPGNIVDISGDNPRPLPSIAQSLRVEPAPGRPVKIGRDVTTYFSYEDQHGLDGAVEMCNGSGVCRKTQGGTMCPSYMATLDERHSTRGRGNALRLAISGQLRELSDNPSDGRESVWNDAGVKETLDLCLSCKACKTECPSNVDIARLKSEYTAQRYDRFGAPLAARIMGEVRTLNRLGAMTPTLANAVNKLAPVRAIINRVLDVHPRRTLPRFSASLARIWGRNAHAPGAPTVALFGDCFTMYNESDIGVACKRVLEACGYRVVLADAGCCGRAKISGGLLKDAIGEADATLLRLRPLIEDDNVRAILVAEPSCLSAFKDDWLQLKLQTPRTLRERLAAKAFLPEDFVERRWGQHPRTPRFTPPTQPVLLHGHCHQKALWGAKTSAALLERLAPGMVRVLDSGCCGMAGSFGYARHRFDLSQQIGELSLFPAARAHPAGAAIAAPGTSCRHQIHDGVARDAVHPIALAASWLADDQVSPAPAAPTDGHAR